MYEAEGQVQKSTGRGLRRKLSIVGLEQTGQICYASALWIARASSQ